MGLIRAFRALRAFWAFRALRAFGLSALFRDAQCSNRARPPPPRPPATLPPAGHPPPTRPDPPPRPRPAMVVHGGLWVPRPRHSLWFMGLGLGCRVQDFHSDPLDPLVHGG